MILKILNENSKMLKSVFTVFLLVSFITVSAQIIDPQKWQATDAIGRNLPESEESLGGERVDKLIGIFYWTWHQRNVTTPIRDITQILASHPEAAVEEKHPAWEKSSIYWWDEPMLGYYKTTDPWVLYKHAQMLSNAQVDVVFFDATNGSDTWKESYMQLLEVWNQARLDGMKVPKIAFMLGFSPNEYALASIKELYSDLYSKKLYPDMWFKWEGKPLIMSYFEMLDIPSGNENEDKLRQDIRSFFTFRPCQPDYVDGPDTKRNDQWNWLEIYPQNGYVVTEDNQTELVSVGVAQNASPLSGGKWHAFNDSGTYGRSFTQSSGQDTRPAAFLYGLNFEEQWSRAFEIDPKLIFITGWNEWIAGRHVDMALPTTDDFEPFAFVDQYTREKSRDCEPVKSWGNHGDNYYMQMVQNIRKFKGIVSKPPLLANLKGNPYEEKSWNAIESNYYDYRGDIMWRNHPGFGDSIIYTNKSGRNDIIEAKVARKKDSIYFMAKTADNLTSLEDEDWMNLYLNLDPGNRTGWQGYDLLLKPSLEDNKMQVYQYDGKKWHTQFKVSYICFKNYVIVALPYRLFEKRTNKIDQISFKWSDNSSGDHTILDFYTNGDSAPDGRFNYSFLIDN